MFLVPHTHWDREWYLPFQSFRLLLVDVVDRVLGMLEADSRFVFTLDGQTATVDDYLEIRPEAEGRIGRLVREGRLAVGPWHILVDEFLVSGESMVRNLERGLARAEELGGAMPVGYLPDMFGHVAQMPQLLRRAGIKHAVVWRGVPAAVRSHAFLWEAPDGSSVRAEYLPNGYGNAAHLLDVPERLAQAVAELDEASRPFFADAPLLAMYGTDHTEPLPELVELVERTNAQQDRYRLELSTVSDYLRATAAEEDGGLVRWRGELRSGARANLLMGVTSARVELKAACARAERLLERYAEPLLALHASEWPERLLELAWTRVIENSAHDSICGCSIDAVADQVLVRYAEAEQIAAGLVRRAAEQVAALVAREAWAVLNPSPHERSDLVELDATVPADWEDIALRLPDGSLAATQKTARSLVACVPVPALGWTSVRPERGRGHVSGGGVRASETAMTNGLVTVELEADGLFGLTGSGVALTGVGRLVDGGDAGDSYNYAPPAADLLVERPGSVATELRAGGPVRGELAVVREYEWPVGVAADCSARLPETRTVAVETRIELRAGEPFVRMAVSFENPCCDHRLRFHVPLAFPAEESVAEGQFAVVERALDPEGGFGERPLATYPARGFVAAGGVAALLEHVLEYELVDGRELALTLLRAVGLISRDRHPYREESAGPEVAIPGAQGRRPRAVAFALYPHARGWGEAETLVQLERYLHPFVTAAGTAATVEEQSRPGLAVGGDGIVLSSLRRRGQELEIRIVCERDEPSAAVLSGRIQGVTEVDLLGRPLGGIDVTNGSFSLELHPWEIRTLRIKPS